MRKERGVGGLGAKLNDEESRGIIFEGCSLSQLAVIFDLDNREIARKIHGLPPCGERMGYPIYKLADAAAYLVPPNKRDIVDAIKRLRPADLPPSLTKEYWAAQKMRAEFEEEQGDLWRTGEVVELLGEVFKRMRMSILLMRDQVDRQTRLTDQQKDIIQTLGDGVLNELSQSLIEQFKNDKRRPGSQHWDDPDEAPEEEDTL